MSNITVSSKLLLPIFCDADDNRKKKFRHLLIKVFEYFLFDVVSTFNTEDKISIIRIFRNCK